jgi:hypothetical protein
MIEFRVLWCRCPTNYNDGKLLFVTAANANDARAVAVDHIERRYGIPRHDFVVEAVTEVKPVPAGMVRE